MSSGWNTLVTPNTPCNSTSTTGCSGSPYSNLPSATLSSSPIICGVLYWETTNGRYDLAISKSWVYGHLYPFLEGSSSYSFEAESGEGLIGSVYGDNIVTQKIQHGGSLVTPAQYHRVSLAITNGIVLVKALRHMGAVLEFITEKDVYDEEMEIAIRRYLALY